MQGSPHRDLPSTESVDEQSAVKSVDESLPDGPYAAWISPGVSVHANLAMPAEHERGVCRCDACRARGSRPPRFT